MQIQAIGLQITSKYKPQDTDNQGLQAGQKSTSFRSENSLLNSLRPRKWLPYRGWRFGVFKNMHSYGGYDLG